MIIDFEKLNKDARELGIEVNENSDNPGLYYRDDNGEKVIWDAIAEFREVFGKIECLSEKDIGQLNEVLRKAHETGDNWSGVNIILPEEEK